MNKIFICLFSLFIFTNSYLSAQQTLIKGKVIDANGTPVGSVQIKLEESGELTSSDESGAFELNCSIQGKVQLVFRKEQWKVYFQKVEINISEAEINLDPVILSPEDGVDQLSSEELIPSVSLTDAEVNDAGGTQNVSGILTSSRDIFFNTAAFAFGAARFSIRGWCHTI